MNDLRESVKKITTQPGVYLMRDSSKKVIYVGKAKNLKNRVSQYFQKTSHEGKTKALVANIRSFETIVTTSETQALILENDLIKQYKPRYNVLLKDSKSYPYIFISKDKHPRVGFYRGNKNADLKFFGPYISPYIVRESLSLMKKIFKVRQCTNTFYKNRSRPCLEYQIGLCSAPCVGKIDDDDYTNDVEQMESFLSGKGISVLENISTKMQSASKSQNYEAAAKYRDQLIGLRTVQEQHTAQTQNDMDIVAIVSKENAFAIEILFIRNGKQIGQRCFYPKNSKNYNEESVLSAFLPQFYIGKVVPKTIVVNKSISEKNIISNALKTTIVTSLSKDKKRLMNVALLTAQENLSQKLSNKKHSFKNLMTLKNIFNLGEIPEHIECFDISHIKGEFTVASCVVFKHGVAKKSEYRKFNIEGVTPGDDYGAMEQAISRRYKRLISEGIKLPSLIFIDGGLGQLNIAKKIFNELNIESTRLIGIAKGDKRKAGFETLINYENDTVQKVKLPRTDSVLMLINRIRDESHRFAITAHRKRRAKKIEKSDLENIEGIGKSKRANLLNYFGGIQEIKNASLEQLTNVKGINESLALRIKENLK